MARPASTRRAAPLLSARPGPAHRRRQRGPSGRSRREGSGSGARSARAAAGKAGRRQRHLPPSPRHCRPWGLPGPRPAAAVGACTGAGLGRGPLARPGRLPFARSASRSCPGVCKSWKTGLREEAGQLTLPVASAAALRVPCKYAQGDFVSVTISVLCRAKAAVHLTWKSPTLANIKQTPPRSERSSPRVPARRETRGGEGRRR